MKFDLYGCNRLPSPLTVEGRTYTIVAKNAGAAVFRSPLGAEVAISFYTWEDSWNTPHSQAYVTVNGTLITPVRMTDTIELADPALRGLVETALKDVMAAELQLDPTGRHDSEARRTGQDAQSVAKRERALRKL